MGNNWDKITSCEDSIIQGHSLLNLVLWKSAPLSEWSPKIKINGFFQASSPRDRREPRLIKFFLDVDSAFVDFTDELTECL